MRAKKMIYDLPLRLYHVVYILLFVGSYSIAQIFDDDSKYFGFHIVFGLTLTTIVFLRVLWGFFGSYYSKFKSLLLSPLDLIIYLKEVTSPHSNIHTGHNPASSYAAIVFIILPIGAFLSGYTHVKWE